MSRLLRLSAYRERARALRRRLAQRVSNSRAPDRSSIAGPKRESRLKRDAKRRSGGSRALSASREGQSRSPLRDSSPRLASAISSTRLSRSATSLDATAGESAREGPRRAVAALSGPLPAVDRLQRRACQRAQPLAGDGWSDAGSTRGADAALGERS